jgi:hypothetical protein
MNPLTLTAGAERAFPPGLMAPEDFIVSAEALEKASRGLFGLPFDAMRLQYANAVRAGLIEPSLLASGRFDHAVTALEQMAYGPFARTV